MNSPNQLPPPSSRILETFMPAERAAFMAHAILDEIGGPVQYPEGKQRPTRAAKWAPSVMPIVYQLLQFDHGTSGNRYHFDVATREGSALLRYMIISGKKTSYIVQLDIDGKRIDHDKDARRAMHAKLLAMLTSSVPQKAEEVMGRLVNEEFNALMGRFIISDLALEINGNVPKVSHESALHAADAHRQYYDRMMDTYGSPRTKEYVTSDDEDDNYTLSFEIVAARAATEIAHQWSNTFNRDTPPELRIPRSS